MVNIPFVRSTASLCKSVIFFINVVSIFVGILLITYGALFEAFFGIDSGYFPMFVFGLGLLTLLVSFFGCLGALDENVWFLKTYLKLLLTIILLQIALGSFAFYYRNDGEKFLLDSWGKAHSSNPSLIEGLEKTFGCCGFYDPKDRAIPPNCRVVLGYTSGCFETLNQTYQDSHEAIGMLGAVLGSLELLCLIGTIFIFIWYDYRSYLLRQDQPTPHHQEHHRLFFPHHQHGSHPHPSTPSSQPQPPSYHTIPTTRD